MKQFPSLPIPAAVRRWAAWRGGMTTEIEATQIEGRNNAYETTPVFWWGWPNEALLADFAEKDDRVEQPDKPIEDCSEYAVLYFVS
jgi:hypothetical protein